MEVFDFTASKHLPYKVRTCMIDGNLLQTAQTSFDFKGRVAVKLTIKSEFTCRSYKLQRDYFNIFNLSNVAELSRS